MASSRPRHTSGCETPDGVRDDGGARHAAGQRTFVAANQGADQEGGTAVAAGDGGVPGDEVASTSDSEDGGRELERLGTAMIRAAMVGGLLKGGLNVFALLARARKKGASRAAAGDAFRDTAAFAAFLTAFAGVYVGVDEGLGRLCGKQRSRRWRAAVAGGLAGPALL